MQAHSRRGAASVLVAALAFAAVSYAGFAGAQGVKQEVENGPKAQAAPEASNASAAKPEAQKASGEHFKVPEVITGLQKSGAGMQVLSSFKAAGGLDGWVVKDANSGKDVVVYTTQDGQVLVAGLVLDKTGKNLSSDYAEKYLPKTDYTAALTEFHDKSAHFDLGKETAKAEITVVYDPNCPYCHAVHKITGPAVAAGDLKVRVVPVAILGRDSPEKAAGLLAATDHAAAIQATTYGLGQVQKSTDPKLAAQVVANTELMRKYGFNGTPVVLYQYTKDGQTTVVASNGVPNIKEMFERLGIKGDLDKISDPSLARFIQ
jgi:thiol:disulfide interchange protein DsbG